MTYMGIVRGKTIELDGNLPYPDGQPVSVSVEPVLEELPLGSPARIRKAMHEPPHLDHEDVADLERAIEEGKLPVRYEGVFDRDDDR